MDFKQLPIFNLKPMGPSEKSSHLTRGSEFVTLRYGRICITNQLYHRLGDPEFVEFALDADKKVFGIRVTDESNKYGRQVSYHDNAGTDIKMSGDIVKDFCNIVNMDLKTNNYRVFPSITYKGYIVFDLDTIVPVEIRRRKDM